MAGSDAPFLAPVKAEVLTGLDRVAALIPHTGFAELTAGVRVPFGAQPDAFVRGELGWKPEESISLFGFAEAKLREFTAGVGARKTF